MPETDSDLSQRLQAWADGRATLKEVRGYTEEELYSLCRMGYFFYYQGKIDEARTVFQGLFAVDPLNGYVARALAVVEMAAGNDRGAAAAYDVALRLNPEDAMALVGRAEIRIFQKNKVQAAEDLRRARHLVAAEHPLNAKVSAMLDVLFKK